MFTLFITHRPTGAILEKVYLRYDNKGNLLTLGLDLDDEILVFEVLLS